VIGALALAAEMGVDLGVGLDVGAGRQLLPAKRIEGLLSKDLARQLDARTELEAVLLGLQVVEADRGRLPRIGGLERDRAAACRSHRADMSLEAMPRLSRAAVVTRRDRQEVILEVGMLDADMAADETAGLEMVGGTESGAEERPLDADQELPQRVLQHGVERDRLQAAVLDVGLDVVLQVLPDTGQVLHDGNAMLTQMVRRSDAREQEDLR